MIRIKVTFTDGSSREYAFITKDSMQAWETLNKADIKKVEYL